MEKGNRRDRIFAILGTLLIMALLFVWLWVDTLSPLGGARTAMNEPVERLEEEEIFIEPEDLSLRDVGEEDATANDAPSAAEIGQPQQSEEQHTQPVEPGRNTEPAPQKPEQISSTKESDVKTQPSPKTDKEKQQVTDKMAGKFDKNGTPGGKNNVTNPGSGGEGVGVAGKVRGRQLLNEPKPQVSIREKTVVTVTVHVDEAGNVTDASATGGGSNSINKACEKAAKQAKWTPKKGAGTVVGTIVYTIYPKL